VLVLYVLSVSIVHVYKELIWNLSDIQCFCNLLKIYKEAVNGRRDNTMAKRKNNKQGSTKSYTEN